MKKAWVLLATLLPTGAAMAAMVEKTVEYQVGDATMQSTLVYDDAGDAKRPGIVMVPNWRGATATAVERAKAIAGRDYVVLVADVFGKGVRPDNDKDSGAQVGKMYKDIPGMRARANAAYEQLKAQAGSAPLDAARIGATGFCFGGAVALEIARTGTPLDAVVTFHANIDPAIPMKAGDAFTPAVLVLNGADDSYVKPEQIAAFEAEMNAVNADWQFHNFAGAVHCFAEEGQNNPPGCVYDKRASDRAWRLMRDFFAEQLGTAK